jgi:hypothetical protein
LFQTQRAARFKALLIPLRTFYCVYAEDGTPGAVYTKLGVPVSHTRSLILFNGEKFREGNKYLAMLLLS